MTRVIDPDRAYERAVVAAAWYRRDGARGVGCVAGRCVVRVGPVAAVVPPTGQTGVTAEQLELISTDPQVRHGQAVLTGTRAPVSVILDCLAPG